MLITHYTRSEPKEGVWVPLRFLCKKQAGAYNFQIGFQPNLQLLGEEVREREEIGSITALKLPVQIGSEEQILWLDSSSNIWLASKQDPLHDEKRVLVGHL